MSEEEIKRAISKTTQHLLDNYDELLRDNGNLYAENKELKQEIEKLNNIINELENELYKFYAYEGYNDEQIKDKIKELKGSESDE